MKINSKIIFTVVITFLSVICILAILSNNSLNMALSTLGLAVLILGFRIKDAIKRKLLIDEIKKHNLAYINTKENNKTMIILLIIMTLNMLNTIETRYEIYKNETTNPSSNIIVFLNSIDNNDKLMIVGVLLVVVLFILALLQTLFNKTIVSNKKIIFYDGVVFKINEIDEVTYSKSLISKNKIIIKLERGLTTRKLIVDYKDINKIKNMLNIKNQS